MFLYISLFCAIDMSLLKAELRASRNCRISQQSKGGAGSLRITEHFAQKTHASFRVENLAPLQRAEARKGRRVRIKVTKANNRITSPQIATRVLCLNLSFKRVSN